VRDGAAHDPAAHDRNRRSIDHGRTIAPSDLDLLGPNGACGTPGKEGGTHAFPPSHLAVPGHRAREWTAVGQTELEVICETARCLREIREGRVLERHAGFTQSRLSPTG
jgi:hypothetical protein